MNQRCFHCSIHGQIPFQFHHTGLDQITHGLRGNLGLDSLKGEECLKETLRSLIISAKYDTIGKPQCTLERGNQSNNAKTFFHFPVLSLTRSGHGNEVKVFFRVRGKRRSHFPNQSQCLCGKQEECQGGGGT